MSAFKFIGISLVVILAIVLFLTIYFRGDLKALDEPEDGYVLPESCQKLADENWSSSENPVPFCANSSPEDMSAATECRSMTSGKCVKPYNYGLCPGLMTYKHGKCT